jgi:hypothetical protein
MVLIHFRGQVSQRALGLPLAPLFLYQKTEARRACGNMRNLAFLARVLGQCGSRSVISYTWRHFHGRRDRVARDRGATKRDAPVATDRQSR